MEDMEKRIYDGTREIVEFYNSAVEKFEPIYADISSGKPFTDLSQKECRELVYIGEILYQTYEKTFKLYCFKIYLEQVKHGSMTQHEFDTKIANVLDKGKGPKSYIDNPVNIHRLANWMAENAVPQLLVHDPLTGFIPSKLSPAPTQLSLTKVDANLIEANAKEGHNNSKHLFDHTPEPKLFNTISKIFPHIENTIKYYCTDNGLKSYCMVSQSGSLPTINNFFEGWRENSGIQFGLIIDSTSELSEKEQQAIVSLPWNLVIDFDTLSFGNGLYKTFETIGKSSSLITPSATDRYSFEPMDKVYWIFPVGSNHESAYLVQNKQKWRNSNANLRNILDRYHSKNTNPIRLLVLSTSEADRVADILDDFFDTYQPVDSTDSYIEIISIYNDSAFSHERYLSNKKNHYQYFNTTKAQFAEYIISAIGINDKANEGYSVPVENNFININPADYPSLDIIYNGIKKDEARDSNKIDPQKFYSGEVPISWYGVANEFPIEIQDLKYLKKEMQKVSGKTKSKMNIIMHEPGAGGSTLLRILAYKKSEIQPTVLLNQYTPVETVKEIERLYIKCQKYPVCIFADSAVLSYDECKEFKDELDSAGYAHDFFYTHRNMESITDDLIWHRLTEFTKESALEFIEKLKIYIDDVSDKDRRLTNLNEIVYVKNREAERLPLIMALYAFDEDFKGIKSYISQFINPLSKEQQNLFIYTAILDIYANENISINMFPHLRLYQQEVINTDNNSLWLSAAKKLLTIVPNVNGDNIKSKHPLFSKEIICQLIGEEKDGKVTFYRNLTNFLCQFIKFTANPPHQESKSNINLLSNIFITKDQTVIMEADQKQYFGPIIDHILNNCDDRIARNKYVNSILNCLTDNYPQNAHFCAHLGRFYSIILKDYVPSIELADKAIKISESEDPLLYHIAAICIRRYINDLIRQYRVKETEKDQLEKEILKWALKASQYFEKSRKNRKPAGYISDIEMCIRLIDFYKSTKKYHDYRSIIKDLDNPYHEYYKRALLLTQTVQATENMLFENTNSKYDLSQETINKTRALLQDLKGTMAFWKNNIDRETDLNKLAKYRFFYVQAAKANDFSTLSTDDLNSCIDSIERNIDLEYNSGSIFIWFELLQNLNDKVLDSKLETADVQLRSWREKYSDKIEIEYYLYIIDTLLLLKGSSSISSSINKVETTLNSYSKEFPKNTTPRRILCKPGNHLADFKLYSKEIESEALELEGTIDSLKNNIIKYDGLSIFFNPETQINYSDSLRGKIVHFKMFIAYKGAYAISNSIIGV